MSSRNCARPRPTPNALDAAELALGAATTIWPRPAPSGAGSTARRPNSKLVSPSWKPRPRDLEEQLANHEAESGSDGKLAGLQAELDRLFAAVSGRTELQAAEAGEEKARFDEAKARALAASAKLVHQEVDTELATLTKLLAPPHDWSPIVEEIKVAAGYEQALGAALGDDLDAASDETAPSHWRVRPDRKTRLCPTRPRLSANSSTRPRRCAAG